MEAQCMTLGGALRLKLYHECNSQSPPQKVLAGGLRGPSNAGRSEGIEDLWIRALTSRIDD